MSHLYSVIAIAEHFGVNTSTVRRWIQQGCPVVDPGGVGRGNGAKLNLEVVERWHRTHVDPLGLVERAIIHVWAQGAERKAKIARVQLGLILMICYHTAVAVLYGGSPPPMERYVGVRRQFPRSLEVIRRDCFKAIEAGEYSRLFRVFARSEDPKFGHPQRDHRKEK